MIAAAAAIALFVANGIANLNVSHLAPHASVSPSPASCLPRLSSQVTEA
jgi:hypothetical protein